MGPRFASREGDRGRRGVDGQHTARSRGIETLPASSASTSGLGGRYAVALFGLAEEQGALDAVAGDLRNLEAMLGTSADLRHLIRSPVLSREQQARALDALGQRAGFYQLTQQFLGFLAHKRRLFALPEITRAFVAMLAEHRGEVTGELISAVPLSAAQIKKVRDQVGRAIGQTVTLSSTVDPNLLGGLVVRVGSRMIDASLRTKLQHLEQAMKGAA
jgi:F-type H+-transporting ATPase subunit delta